MQSASLAAGLILFVLPRPAFAADAPSPSDVSTKPPTEDTSDGQRSLRAFLQLQEQMHSALLAIDEARQAAETAAKGNTEALTERLKMIEQAIAKQREHEMESIQSLNRLVLIAVGVFAGIGLIGLFCMGWLQLRAMNRLAEVATPHPPAPILGYTPVAGALLAGDARGDAGVAAPATQAGLRGVIERLDERVSELEDAAHVRIETGVAARKNGDSGDESAKPVEAVPGAAAEPAPETDGFSLLLGKGQALMHLGQTDKALACFDEVLALDPGNAEALVKKGGALERLERLEEAIACYDRAIEVNDSMTLAYLQKGGVCNRLERFDEALKCYEQALRVQEKG
jgi:tetratricopeptide (TPR) repeat protein